MLSKNRRLLLLHKFLQANNSNITAYYCNGKPCRFLVLISKKEVYSVNDNGELHEGHSEKRLDKRLITLNKRYLANKNK